MVFSAAVIASRYMSSMLSPPPLGEEVKTCASASPAISRSGKYDWPCRTLPVVLIQLSMNDACICATAGPSMR